MKCGRLRASNCFEVFFPSPSFAKPPQPPSSPALFFSPRRFLSFLPADPRVSTSAHGSLLFSLSPLRLLLRSLHFFPLSVDWTTFFFPIVFLGQSFRLRLFSVVSRVSFFFSFFEGCMRVTILESIGSMFEQCNSVIVLCINVPVKNNSYFHEFFRIIYFNIEARK